MPDVKIVFFDIDGTLVDPRTGRISDRTMQAVKALRDGGVKCCISTGRPPASLPDFGGMSFDAMCTFNGSLCYTDTEVIHSSPIDRSDARTVMENAAALGRAVSIATRDRLAANGFDQDLADYYRLAAQELNITPDFDALCREDIYQIMVGSRPEEHAALIQGAPGVKIAISWDRAVDVIPAMSGKGAAIRKILAHFGLDPSQAMAFGDGMNDLEMLQLVGRGVAMGNAGPRLKAAADDVCLPVAEDGIYHYCRQLGLID
ncbi:MAG: HAD family phosphatase [Clostridia bacterium]|nr:HAD family phosphatase [Clostridia bacterium]